MSKPKLVAIFAHPDDEAFGPSGTIAKHTQTHDVYLICATHGESGENFLDDSTKSIGEIREEELRNSDQMRDYFIYVPNGFKCERVDEIVNITDFWELKKKAISAHKSQNSDGSRILAIMDRLPKEEYFLVQEKDNRD